MKAVPVPSSPPSPASALPAQVLAAMADTLVWPLFVLRRDGSLVHANRAAWRLLEHGQPLTLTPQRRVTPAAAARRAAFDLALATAADGQPQGLLRWAGEHAGHTAMLAPLRGTGGTGGTDGSDPAVLLALGAADGQATDIAGFASLHGLSYAETRVLERLALGESSVAAAAALGVRPATVRSQAMTMRRKTGHNSVADLLRALAAMPPVLLAGELSRQGE